MLVGRGFVDDGGSRWSALQHVVLGTALHVVINVVSLALTTRQPLYQEEHEEDEDGCGNQARDDVDDDHDSVQTRVLWNRDIDGDKGSLNTRVLCNIVNIRLDIFVNVYQVGRILQSSKIPYFTTNEF